MQKTFQYFLLPILSGIFVGTSYIPFPPWALFFCLVPLWIFWSKETSYKKIFFGGWITQFILNAIGFHWIAHTVVEFGRMPWIAGLLVLLLFCALAHLYYAIAGVVWKFLCQKFSLSQTTSFLLLPFVFVLFERLNPTIFYWHLGYPWLWAKLPGLQLADTIGFMGLNTLTLLLNGLVALCWIHRKKLTLINRYSISAVALLASINLLGLVRAKMIPTPDRSIKVLAVQGNVGNLEKIQAQEGGRFIHTIVESYLRLSKEGLKENPDVDLVVWPETAFPEVVLPNRLGYYQQRLANLSEQHNIHLLTGAYQRLNGVKHFNGLILMEGTEVLSSYQKTVLLAFGEYLPFGETFPKLKTLLPMVSDFGRGKGPSILEFPDARIGAQICYEGLFDDFSTQLQQKGAQIFINVTNDSWFGYPFEPYQHMYMTLARAIENRRPLVRVTNTGISTAILHTGEVLEMSPINQEWYKTYEIPIHSTPPSTFYVNVAGKWPLILLILIGLIIAGDKIARTGKH